MMEEVKQETIRRHQGREARQEDEAVEGEEEVVVPHEEAEVEQQQQQHHGQRKSMHRTPTTDHHANVQRQKAAPHEQNFHMVINTFFVFGCQCVSM